MISFNSSSYSVREPQSQDDYVTVQLSVHRHGDVSQTSQVRVSTRDRSAVSGIDYSASSQILYFMPSKNQI